jgi:tRNA(Ile)-lysidine synthase
MIDPFLRKILRTVRKHRLFQAGDRVLAAVSGGPDSTALLQGLAALKGDVDLEIHVAHLHHGIRGEEADRDLEFVRESAHRLALPCSVDRVDVKRYCREKGLSLQEGGRELRYAFLHRLADEMKCSRIALGHTLDDQAETVLMRLLRGASIHGMGGIPPVRGNIVRPLIETGRGEILAYLKAQGIPYREDPSNASPA